VKVNSLLRKMTKLNEKAEIQNKQNKNLISNAF